MPMVGKKEYSYSAKGMAMAKADAKKTGKKMVMKKTSLRRLLPRRWARSNVCQRREVQVNGCQENARKKGRLQENV
jgi:hypothetical protein